MLRESTLVERVFMNQKSSISVLQVIHLSMTVIGLKNRVTIISSLLEDARRDGWISVNNCVSCFISLYLYTKSSNGNI